MSEEKNSKSEHQAPAGSSNSFSMDLTDRPIQYTAETGWILLRKKEEPVAEMFHVFYKENDTNTADRPLTFVFNGGPGAASAYLHIGGLGPKRVAFEDDGTPMKPPARLVDNMESWLGFTDLVFIDPIGTGLAA
jgi:carboxypeptidase C (cathepsin A)